MNCHTQESKTGKHLAINRSFDTLKIWFNPAPLRKLTKDSRPKLQPNINVEAISLLVRQPSQIIIYNCLNFSGKTKQKYTWACKEFHFCSSSGEINHRLKFFYGHLCDPGTVRLPAGADPSTNCKNNLGPGQDRTDQFWQFDNSGEGTGGMQQLRPLFVNSNIDNEKFLLLLLLPSLSLLLSLLLSAATRLRKISRKGIPLTTKNR